MGRVVVCEFKLLGDAIDFCSRYECGLLAFGADGMILEPPYDRGRKVKYQNPKAGASVDAGALVSVVVMGSREPDSKRPTKKTGTTRAQRRAKASRRA